MTSLLSKHLCRSPRLYLALLKLRTRFNAEKAIYLQLIKRGDVVMEVGANQGYFTELFAHLAGDRGKLFAFEPVPSTRALLQTRVKSANLRNVQILPFAASNQDGETLIYLPGDTHGQASLKLHHGAGAWAQKAVIQEIPVHCVRVENLPEMKALGRLDFIKVDTEGAELPALQGMRSLLEQYHPILHLEVETQWMSSFGYGAVELQAFLRDLGYNYFWTYDRAPAPLASLVSLNQSANVICGTGPRVFN